MQHLIQLAVVFRKPGAIGFGMPQMQDSTGEPAVLAAPASADETDENIGVLSAPAAIEADESINLFEVRTPERHVAAAGAAPAPRIQLAHRAEAQFQQWRETVELVSRTQHQPPRKPPYFGLKSLTKNTVGQISR